MGKYQLDNKGKKQVQRFYEKNSYLKRDKKERVNALKENFLDKLTKRDMMALRRPDLSDQETITEMIKEFESHNSQHDGGFWNPDEFSYNDWLQQNRENEMGIIPILLVPSIQLVSFDVNNRALGFLSLRLHLNDVLLQKGGHIGYSIRPTERGKGYAKEQLRQGLKLAKEKNIKSVLLTCHKDNLASKKTILACGGRYEDTCENIERYWINLEG